MRYHMEKPVLVEEDNEYFCNSLNAQDFKSRKSGMCSIESVPGYLADLRS